MIFSHFYIHIWFFETPAKLIFVIIDNRVLLSMKKKRPQHTSRQVTNVGDFVAYPTFNILQKHLHPAHVDICLIWPTSWLCSQKKAGTSRKWLTLREAASFPLYCSLFCQLLNAKVPRVAASWSDGNKYIKSEVSYRSKPLGVTALRCIIVRKRW